MTLLFYYKLLIVRDEEKYKLNLRKYDPHSRFIITKVVVVITLTQMNVFGAESCFTSEVEPSSEILLKASKDNFVTQDNIVINHSTKVFMF